MLPPLVDRVRDLVALPSVSSIDTRFDQSNRRVVELLATWAESLGFRCEITPLPDQPDKVNLVAVLGPSSPGGVVFAGHTDTVPWDDSRWSSDPFKLTERDGALYGLGTADMKSFFAAVLESVQKIDRSKLRAPIVLVATADEESTMAGAQALVTADRLHERFAIVGEPTGLVPKRMHKGALMLGLRIVGRSGHSSDPSLGNNAIDGLSRVLRALDAYRATLARRFRNDAFAVPTPTMSFGAVHGGDSPNRICGQVDLRFDLRALPGMSLREAEDEIGACIAEALEGTGLSHTFGALHAGTPAFETPATAELVRVAAELTGSEPDAVGYGTEAPYFVSLGHETLILGAGSIDCAHQPDEHVRLDALHAAAELYARMIARLVSR